MSNLSSHGRTDDHGLTTKHERLLRLEETARQRKLKLTDARVRALERFDPEFRDQRYCAPRFRALRHERKIALKVLKLELAAVVGAERFLAGVRRRPA
ncbi:MAG: hypothetical protein OXI46_08660 [Gemmatimonadota bacterium]|nr:hypothetical protein [Gemmatimonadota bacterium]